MNQNKMLIHDLLFHRHTQDLNSLFTFVEGLKDCKVTDANSLQLIDLKFLEAVKKICSNGETIYFGKTLKDMKYIYHLENVSKPLEVFITYKSCEKLIISELSVPHSAIQDQEYSSLEELIISFKSHIDSLSAYLHELENIDKYCTVIEPLCPTFKDDYRRILLDERTWLHIEVNQAGLAKNLHLLGQISLWQDKLQAGLLNWNHDKDIVENIMTILDITQFPAAPNTSIGVLGNESTGLKFQAGPSCGICMCDTLPDDPSLPQPLCCNPTCGVHYHRNCLFQWLVACAGGRPPTFGVATGSCPTCLEPVTCNAKDK